LALQRAALPNPAPSNLSIDKWLEPEQIALSDASSRFDLAANNEGLYCK
jgi:hypothetical protein